MAALTIAPVHDEAGLRDFHAVEAAALDNDFVALPADPYEELLPNLQPQPRAGQTVLLFLARQGSTPVGTLSLRLPVLDNLTTANVGLDVHPDHRGQGVGRALLQHGLEQARAQGRTRVFTEAPAPAHEEGDGPLGPLLRSVGSRPVLREYRRLLDLQEHPVGPPAMVASGYQVVQWVDEAPQELVDGLAYLLGRMVVDTPMGEMDYEQEKWDAARYRDAEAAARARNRMRLGTAVVHQASGQVAGTTDIGVNRDRHEVAYQWDTIVDPDHRGHGLGRVLKTWNHRLLTERCPGTRWVNTWNAASNTFMIAINEELGFRPVERWSEWQLDL